MCTCKHIFNTIRVNAHKDRIMVDRPVRNELFSPRCKSILTADKMFSPQ